MLNLRYPGQYFDAESGLVSNGFRDCYEPSTGRYCQSDPTGLDGGISTYAYTGDDPLSYTDPSGLICISDGVANVIGAAAGGFVTGALTGMATGKGNLWAILTGGLAGAGIGAGVQATGDWLGGLDPGNKSGAAGFAAAAGSLIQDKGNVGLVVANGMVGYFGDQMGFQNTPGIMMTSKSATYIGAATFSNSDLGAGALVAGPLFGLAGAFTDLAVNNAIKSHNHCDCGK